MDAQGEPSGPRPATMDLPSFVEQVLAEAEPMAQNTEAGNLGFGWLYYAFVRNLRPAFVVAIGSRYGFMPFCAARALQDNGRGQLVFIDPSYSGEGHPGWGGADRWSEPARVQQWIEHFGLGGWMTHLHMTSEEAFPRVRELLAGESLGTVIIDGAHTYEHSLRDFDLYSSLMSEGVVLLHDATNSCCEVSRTLETLRARGLPVVTLHRGVGLAVVEVQAPPAVEETWVYLVQGSDRGQRLLPLVRKVLRPGDGILDAYCGYSPLGSLLTDVSLFGWDRDPRIIARLRAEVPGHRWEQIEEGYLPYAELPAEIQVLMGLGVSRGHAPWDPKYVVPNMQYLIGRYAPRACVFESAADYCGADILDDLQAVLDRHGYRYERHLVETNMASFSRRVVLLAERSNPHATGTRRGEYAVSVPPRPLRVFAEVLPDTLGRVIHRINAELKRHAPAEVSFVTDPAEADLQVLDVLGTGSPPHLQVRDHVLLQHVFSTTETRDPAYWLPHWQRARLVMSSLDLYELVGSSGFPFYRAPYGVDGSVFRDRGLPRSYAVMTSGFVPGAEAIRECCEAARRLGMQTLHLGPDFDWGPDFHAVLGISDEELARCYSRCHYVSGLRRSEGFELPVLEGLACGARPICFDSPIYRYWFGDHAAYVPEGSEAEVIDALTEVFARPPPPVTPEERREVLERFAWEKIFGGFWSRVLTAMAA
jgi:hypothetical protein